MTLKFNRVLEVVEVHVRAKSHQDKCSGSWVINSALDFEQPWTLIANITGTYSNRQAENGVINYDSSHVRRKQFDELWSTYEKNDLDVWPMTNRVHASRYVFMQNFIKLRAAVDERNKKAQLTQRERATAVHVWRPTANECKIRKNLYFSAQGHSRSLLSASIETRVWLSISD